MNNEIDDLRQNLRNLTKERDKLKKELEALKDNHNSADYIKCYRYKTGYCIFEKESGNKERMMLMHPSVEKARSLASRGKSITPVEWQDILNALELHLNEFYLNLLKEQLHLTEQEFKVCVLARLHFIPSEMSCLLNLT